MHAPFSVDEMHGCEDTGTQHRPYLLFGEGPLLLDAGVHFGLEGVIDVLEDKNDLVEGGAEGVLGLGGEMLEVENVFVLVRELEGVHVERILIGLLGCE